MAFRDILNPFNLSLNYRPVIFTAVSGRAFIARLLHVHVNADAESGFIRFKIDVKAGIESSRIQTARMTDFIIFVRILNFNVPAFAEKECRRDGKFWNCDTHDIIIYVTR